MKDAVHEGGCECRGVRYRVTGELSPVVNCHCGQCRRIHGHYLASTVIERTGLELVSADSLRWYESSSGVRRGFCGNCGGSLFWEQMDGPTVSIAAGTLDGPTGLTTVGHIYVADAGDYYAITDGLPTFPQSDGGQLDWPLAATIGTDDGDPAG